MSQKKPAPRQPQDHKAPTARLPKKARRQSIDVVLDGEVHDAYVKAHEALKSREGEIIDGLQARLTDLRTSMASHGEAPDTIAAEFKKMRAADEKELSALRGKLEEARIDLEKVTATITFQSIGRRAWDKLVRSNPPSEEELALVPEGGQPPSFSDEAMAPKIVDQSLVSAVVDGEEYSLDGIFDDQDWNIGELQLVYNAALEAQLSTLPTLHEMNRRRRN